MFRFIKRLFGKQGPSKERADLIFGNAEVFNLSVSNTQGDRAVIRLSLEICGTNKVFHDVVWLVPNHKNHEYKEGGIISVRYNRKMTKVEPV